MRVIIQSMSTPILTIKGFAMRNQMDVPLLALPNLYGAGCLFFRCAITIFLSISIPVHQ